MKINKIEIKNFVGIEELVLEPGKINIIKGKNAAGKTSVINAIITAIGGGHNASLIRNGSNKAQIGIDLDNGMSIKKTITQSSATLNVSKDGKKIEKAQSTLNELFKMFSVNPLELLVAPKKYRAELLLSAIPMDIEDETIKNIFDKVNLTPKYSNSDNGIEILNTLKKQIYDERTTINRIWDIKKKGIANIEARTFDSINPDTIQTDYDILIAKKSEMEEKRNTYLEKITDDKNKALEEALKDYEEMKMAINNQFEVQKEQLNKSFEINYTPILEQIANQKAALDNMNDIILQKKQLQEDKEEALNLEKDSNNLTDAINEIEQLKADLQNNLPIAGLEIINGDILLNGVLFENLNTAEQMKLCIAIAKLHNTSGLMIVDGIERLDSVNQNILIEQAKEAGLQLIISEVSDDSNITIETIEE